MDSNEQGRKQSPPEFTCVRWIEKNTMGVAGVSAEIPTVNLSNICQKRHRLKLSLGDLTQKFDAINKRTSCG